jgi:hypothetical protein
MAAQRAGEALEAFADNAPDALDARGGDCGYRPASYSDGLASVEN